MGRKSLEKGCDFECVSVSSFVLLTLSDNGVVEVVQPSDESVLVVAPEDIVQISDYQEIHQLFLIPADP